MKRGGEPKGSSGRERRSEPIVALIVGAVVAIGAYLALGAMLDGGGSGRATVSASRPTEAGASTSGRSLFARMGCGNCHAFRAGNSTGSGAPDLDVALAGHTRRSLKAKIVDPKPERGSDSFGVMPEDIGRRMSEEELDALVTFLLESR